MCKESAVEEGCGPARGAQEVLVAPPGQRAAQAGTGETLKKWDIAQMRGF